MKIEEIIKICKQRNELDFLFQITKTIAEADSIGEGHGYCDVYTKESFNNAEKENEGYYSGDYCQYLKYGAIPVYKLYLKQINVI